MKLESQACERNKDIIATHLKEIFSTANSVIEFASGTGQHAIHFAQTLSHLVWQPTDMKQECLDSIRSYISDSEITNIKDPVIVDVNQMSHWNHISTVDAMFCANMIHISEWKSCQNLFMLAAQRLNNKGYLVLYGPYIRSDVVTAPSNVEFDLYLKSQNPEWGIRKLDEVDFCALKLGLNRTKLIEMPANNLILVYQLS